MKFINVSFLNVRLWDGQGFGVINKTTPRGARKADADHPVRRTEQLMFRQMECLRWPLRSVKWDRETVL